MEKYQLIADDVKLGQNVKIYSFVNLYGCEVGDDTKIGTFVEIQRDVTIGRRCKISSHTFVCSGVSIGDDCFIGHGVMFTNYKKPRASILGKPVTTEWQALPTIIENEVSIGSNATILCGITIGRGVLIGAGATVTKNIAAGATACMLEIPFSLSV